MSSGPRRAISPWRIVGLAGVAVLVTLAAIRIAAPGGPAGTAERPSNPVTAPSSPAATEAATPVDDLGPIGLAGRVDAPPVSMPGPVDARAYAVHVTDPGGRLRVSVDLSNRDDCVELRLTDPDGVTRMAPSYDYPYVCPSSGRSGQAFGIEASVADAAPGRWRVDVAGLDVRDLRLRLRAVLDPAPTAERLASTDRLLPDLVPWLPWEFGFAAPVSDTPGTAHDRDNGPGDPTVSCHPQEEADDAKCLRFSAGVYNTGDGPLSVVFRGDRAIQHIYRSDATPLDHTNDEREARYEERDAGSGEWHPFHEHRHLAEFVLYQLFAVADDGRTLVALDDGAKHGYCTFSQQIADWTAAAQDPQYASFPDGVFCEDAMALERGWGDVYRWQRPGQYLSYAAAADDDGSMAAGRYLVRFVVDPEDHIAELDESNNTGYALIQVVDGGAPGTDTVVVCEQGLGTDPWDADSVVVEDRFAWARIDDGRGDPGDALAACD